MPIHDISRPLSAQLPVWPGDPPVEIARLGTGAGSEPSVSRVCLSSHAGTHVDPPAHYLRDGTTVDRLPLDVLVGPAWLAHLAGPSHVTATALAAAGIPAGTQRLLLRTANSDAPLNPADFDPSFIGLTEDAARWLLAAGIRLVGIDGPSIEPFESPGDPGHRLLLGAGVIIVEGLVLAGVSPGPYQFYCLPLPIAGGDGAPARAVLIDEGVIDS